MRRWFPLCFPLALFAGLAGLLSRYGVVSKWYEYPSFGALPSIVFGLAALLGVFFAQSRVVFLAALFGAVSFQTHQGFARGRPPGEMAALLQLSLIAIPLMTASLYRLRERGLVSVYGCTRAAATLVVVLAMAVLSRASGLVALVTEAPPRLLAPATGPIPLPPLAVILFLGSLPFLCVRKAHESPLMGLFLAWAALFAFTALTFESRVWGGEGRASPAALLGFMSGVGVLLVWVVMESAWRHATIDELTELPGRRAFNRHLNRLGAAYAIAIVDADHFKQVNDRYGHDTGDQVLRFLAAHLQANSVGKAYRYGGEEFALVCEGRDFRRTVAGLEDLRAAVAEEPFRLRGEDRPDKKPKDGVPRPSGSAARALSIPVAVSIGVAAACESRPTPQAVVEAADKALYRAKSNGRNRVCATRQ